VRRGRRRMAKQLNERNAAALAKLMQLWVKPQPGGSLVILLLNMVGSGVESVIVQLDFASDVWARKDIGSGAQRNLSVAMQARGIHMFVLRPRRSDGTQMQTSATD
jgi:hypothetical protein